MVAIFFIALFSFILLLIYALLVAASKADDQIENEFSDKKS